MLSRYESIVFCFSEEPSGQNLLEGVMNRDCARHIGQRFVFPKSTTPARIKENFEIFDFELEPDDIAAISALDRGEEGRTGPNPDVFAYVPR